MFQGGWFGAAITGILLALSVTTVVAGIRPSRGWIWAAIGAVASLPAFVVGLYFVAWILY